MRLFGGFCKAMPNLRVIIPTRDSARWIGAFLKAYRRSGIEPIYIVDTRSKDATFDILRDMSADLVPFTPTGDFVEAGMVEFGSRQAGAEWILRLDDDEFPSAALLRWVYSIGVKSLNQAWNISRRELFLHEGDIFYSRSPGCFRHPQAPEYLGPQGRFHRVDRVKYINRIHTVGFESPRYFPLAPEDAFFVHCNCLLRTPVERWEKIRKYEEIEPLSTLRIADEYLPELYDVAHHDAKRDGLEEFAELFDALPIQWSAALPKIDSVTLDLINREISNLHALMSSSRLDHPVVSADDFAWLRYVPRRLWKPLAEILCTLGKRQLGGAIWAYETDSRSWSPA
jgi:hypothetical protein